MLIRIEPIDNIYGFSILVDNDNGFIFFAGFLPPKPCSLTTFDGDIFSRSAARYQVLIPTRPSCLALDHVIC